MADSTNDSKIITAPTEAEVNKEAQKEIIEQGWEADGAVYKNPDGTFSQKLVK